MDAKRTRRAGLKVAAAAVALLALGALLSCSDFFIDPGALVSISISPSSPTLALNNSTGAKSQQQLTATATFTNGTTQDVSSSATWLSNNTSIANVSSTGLVTANSTTTGTASITATFQGTTSTGLVVTVQ